MLRTLEHCRELAGGWKLVVMNYLAPEDGWHSLAEKRFDEGLEKAVQQSMARTRQLSPAHLHGDLRPSDLCARRSAHHD
ncbi:hypothetical protein WJX73_003367 [Symbiochloris irregularis]|uniref:Uncharacterized protein n=1 Tax=Symbiochloris irregularis TaxID=706552 RepID=A0AAW1Q3K6_9CHLO